MSHDRDDEDPSERRTSDQNQGEGDRASARRYNDHVREFVVYGDVPRAASDARDSVEGPEGPELASAEARGKAPARMTRFERLEAIVRRVRNVIAEMLADLSDRVAVSRHAR